jgi:hypothetical protein
VSPLIRHDFGDDREASGRQLGVPARVIGEVEDALREKPLGTLYLAVVCDGCGQSAEIDPSDPRHPPGWTIAGQGPPDLCPACREG